MRAKTKNSGLTNIPKIKLGYSIQTSGEQMKINSSQDAFTLITQHWNHDTIELFEEFKVLYLNRCNIPIGLRELSKGSSTGTVVDVKQIITIALLCSAQSMILFHNHPSTNLSPSTQDEKLTKKIHEACKYFDLKLLDHLIITKQNYYSFTDEGMI